jgi:hypothetical protein
MAKKRDINAFQEINGAFAEGKLKKFNDYNQTDAGSRILDMGSFTNDLYIEFMRSWAYRARGMLIDSWQELTLNEIFKDKRDQTTFLASQNDPSALPFLLADYPLYDEKLYYSDGNGNHLIVDKLDDLPIHRINLHQDFKDSSLKEILSADKELKQILFTDGDILQTKLFTLAPNQNLYLFDPINNEKRSFFDLEGWS